MERMRKPSLANQISDDLVNQVCQSLFSASPDPAELHARLETVLDVPSDDARAILYQVVRRLNDSLFPPVTTLELILTEGCNLACAYCFEKDMLGYRRMPLDTAKAAVDLLFDYSGNEPRLRITHFGGEPTLNLATLQGATEYAKSKAVTSGKTVHFDMTTNGVTLNEAMVAYLVEQDIEVLLSIDGLRTTHDRYRLDKRGQGTFERVIEGLRVLKKARSWISVKLTVMPVNAPHLFDDVVGLYNLGANEFIIGYATGIDWSTEERRVYSQQLGKIYDWYKRGKCSDLRIPELDTVENVAFFGCRAGSSSITVTVNGEISPCAKILALNNRQLLAKLGDVQYGLTYFKNRQNLVGCSELRSACEAEGIANEFQGGCFAENYEDNKELFRPSLQGHAFSLGKRSACSGCTSCKN